MKVVITHPILHNGEQFAPGTHELDNATAKHFVENLPHAAQPHVPPVPERRKSSAELFAEAEAAEALENEEAAAALTDKAAELFAKGKTVTQVAKVLKITDEEAAALNPEGKE